MPPLDQSRNGRLATDAELSGTFLDRVLDRAAGQLRLNKRGRIWEAIATAHQSGQRGAGRLVAVIDGGFDLTVADLTRDLHPASQINPHNLAATGAHGTVVSLMIREAAPECQLLLLDVADSLDLDPVRVAAALDLARGVGADVINLSLEFTTTCPLQDTAWIRPDVLATPTPPRQDYVDQVGEWLNNAEPYAGARCNGTCPVCDAVAAQPELTLLVAASGNHETTACPACVARVVGVGFVSTHTIQVNGSVFTQGDLPASKGHMERAELAVEQPPGFGGTSFAAPLLTGLAATVEHPEAISEVAKLSRALPAVLLLASLQWHTGAAALPEGAPGILHAGLIKFADAIPTAHRHFDQDLTTHSCALCTLLLIDWYDVYVSLFIAAGPQTTALAMARTASVLAPNTPSVAGNHGLAAERCAGQTPDGAPRTQLLAEAKVAYTAAVELAGDVAMYRDALARVSAS